MSREKKNSQIMKKNILKRFEKGKSKSDKLKEKLKKMNKKNMKLEFLDV